MKIRLRTLLFAALAVLVLPFLGADAQVGRTYGPLNNCSGTVGGTAAAVAFTPTETGGPTSPNDYLLIQNNSTSSQTLWVSVLINAGNTPLVAQAATTTQPSIQIAPTASLTFYSPTTPVPSAISVIASASGAVYTCIYR